MKVVNNIEYIRKTVTSKIYVMNINCIKMRELYDWYLKNE